MNTKRKEDAPVDIAPRRDFTIPAPLVFEAMPSTKVYGLDLMHASSIFEGLRVVKRSLRGGTVVAIEGGDGLIDFGVRVKVVGSSKVLIECHT